MHNLICDFSTSHEYQTLRYELGENKRYVFERPLLIVTAGLASAQFVDKSYISFSAFAVIALLLFNLWFTVNRLKSSARIVAYIQVILENNGQQDWRGWESFLRHWRRWTRRNKEKIDSIIFREIEEDAIPDALTYYSPIYAFHMITVILSTVFCAMNVYQDTNIHNYVALILSSLSAGYIFLYGIKFRPSRMKRLIEEYRIICIQVVKDILDQEANESQLLTVQESDSKRAASA